MSYVGQARICVSNNIIIIIVIIITIIIFVISKKIIIRYRGTEIFSNALICTHLLRHLTTKVLICSSE